MHRTNVSSINLAINCNANQLARRKNISGYQSGAWEALFRGIYTRKSSASDERLRKVVMDRSLDSLKLRVPRKIYPASMPPLNQEPLYLKPG